MKSTFGLPLRFWALATWVGLLVGLAEALLFFVARNYPLINAAHKVSLEGVWLAPMLDTAVWCVAGFFAALPLFVGWVARHWQRYLLAMTFLMVFAGALVVISAPELITKYAALALSAGVAVVACRRIASREDHWLQWAGRKILCVPVIILACFVVVAGGSLAMQKWAMARLPQAAPGAPNVILMVLDTVRRDRLPPNTYDKIKLPALDRIAQESTVFANAWTTASWSLPSQTSLVTGHSASEHGADWHSGKLRKGTVTLGDYFQRRGYLAAAFSGNAAWITPEYFGHGFNYFEPIPLGKTMVRLGMGRRLSKYFPDWSPLALAAADLNTAFLNWLSGHPNRPFFAYICYMDVNNSGHEEIMHQAEVAIGRYDTALGRVDQRIGELERELERRGLKENTILIVTSDHGESFGAQGQDHEQALHMTSVYPEQMRIPLMIRWPQKVAGGALLQQTVSLKQVPATLEKLLDGQASVFSSPMDLSAPVAAEQCVFGDLRELKGSRTHAMVACGSWEFILHGHNEELYNMESDPRAHANAVAAPENAERRAKMHALLTEWLQKQDEAAKLR